MTRTLALPLLLAAALTAPAAPVLRVDPDATLSLRTGPHEVADLSRERYFRLYHLPGMFNDRLTGEMKSLRVSPARGTGPYFSDNGGDTNRAAYDPSVERSTRRYVDLYRRVRTLYPDGVHAIAGGSYPRFTRTNAAGGSTGSQHDATMHVSHNRTVPPADYAPVSALVSRWLAAIAQGGGSVPRYFSPLNEPDTSWKNGAASAQQYADFSRVMALRLRADHPEVRLAGPCTSWPHPGPDWKRWAPGGWERAFIETVGDVAGAYDFHFYDKELWAYGTNSPGFQPQRRQATPNLFASLATGHPLILDFGRGAALLDLVQALHLARWSNAAPPVIISEFGRQGITPQLGPWASDYLYYLYGTTVTRLWMMFMDRPEIALTVPFILPESDTGYGPRRGQALYTRPGAPTNFTPHVTPLRDFYAFFRDLEGTRVPAEWSGLDPLRAVGVFTIAARHGDELFVLIHNAAPEPLAFDLELGNTRTIPDGARVARLRWEGPAPADYQSPNPDGARWRRDTAATDSLAGPRVELAAEETVLLRIPVSTPPARTVTERRYYAPQTLQPLDTGTHAAFQVFLPAEYVDGPAFVTLGFAAPAGAGPGQHLAVTVNGRPLADPADLSFTAGWREVVLPVRAPVPAGLLRPGVNDITVTAGPAGLPPSSRILSARVDVRRETARHP